MLICLDFPNIFELNWYDEDNDQMIPKNKEAFEKLVEMHPTVNKLKRDVNRDEKVANLKAKVLETLKVNEKKKRDLSCESVKSGCLGWDSGAAESERRSADGSRSRTRNRSGNSDDESNQSKPSKQARKSRTFLQPPKIILSQ